MRHNKQRHKLGVTSSHRSAMLSNLCSSLIEHGRIKTTLAKAKALRPFAEKIITLAKKADASDTSDQKLHYRRLAIARIRNKGVVKKLFDETAAEFKDRPGGYTRIYKTGQRRGDAAETAIIELVLESDEGYGKKNKNSAKKAVAVSDSKSEAQEASTSSEENLVESPEVESPEVKVDEDAAEDSK